MRATKTISKTYDGFPIYWTKSMAGSDRSLNNKFRAAQLAGLPDGGATLGQRTPFPTPVANTDFKGLPAVLRGIDAGSAADSREQANDWLWDYWREVGRRRDLTD